MKLTRRILLALVLMAGITPVFAQVPPPVPALPDAERRTSYSIAASTCSCSVGFQIYGDNTDFASWLEVWLNGVNVAYNDATFGWTITVPSGSLATRSRPISDAVLTFNAAQTGTVQIVGARRPRRVAQFAENTGVPARALNQAITDLVAMERETWDRTNDIAGRAPLLPPGETMGTLPPLASRANMGVCFDSNGRFAPCVGAPSGSFVAGSGVVFTGTNPTTISTPYQAGTGITFTGSNPITISANPTSSVPIIPSRATAIALDLHLYSVVQTAGYASGGDGGGAMFKNVGASALLDTGASFTDSVGTHFQYIVDQGNYINVRQLGAKCDYTTTKGDAGSTDDTTAIQNALNFGGLTVQPTVDGGGVAGQNVLLPFGNCLTGALTVPFGVKFRGQNAWSSQLKFLDSLGAAVIPVTLCDPTNHLACFGTQIADMTLRGGSGTANINVPMVFSNNVQQLNAVYRVAFYPVQRGCIQYDSGYGGAAWFGVEGIECTMSSIGTPGFNFTNIGTTILKVKDSHVEFGGSGVSANGIQHTGGILDVDGFHTEGVSTGIMTNVTGSTSNGALRAHNLSGGVHCTNLVLKQTGSVANDVIVGMAFPNGCTNTINNGGALSAAVQVGDTTF